MDTPALRARRRESVLTAMLCMQRWPWEQGVAAQALLASGRGDLALLMARDAVANRCKDGRLAMKNDRYASLDPAANGEAVLAASWITGQRIYADAAQDMLTYLTYRAPRSREGLLLHNVGEGQLWLDAAFMAPPFLALMGCGEEAFQQLNGLRTTLRDKTTGLYRHVYDCDLHTFIRPDPWGVGNGWMLAGYAKTAAFLPAGSARTAIETWAADLVSSLLRYRRPDGLFHNIVDDPATFIETNLAQMFCFGVYTGIRHGWLATSFRQAADESREAICQKVDADGFVQDVCGTPAFDRPGVAAEGQAFFLLMESALDALNAAEKKGRRNQA